MDIELYEHQKTFLKKDPNKCLLHWDTGTGKTLAAIKWADQKEGTVLVVCPKSILEKWEREIATFSKNKDDFTVLTKETLRRDYDKLHRYESVIVDEAHHVAGMRNARKISLVARNLHKYLNKNKVENTLLLTATAYLSTPYNIFMLAKHLGYNWNYREFTEQFFTKQYFGSRAISVPRKDIEEDIATLIHAIGDVVHIEECNDIPEQTFIDEVVSMTPKQSRAKGEVEETLPIVRFTKFHQIENGTLKGNEYEDHQYFPNRKLDYVVEYATTTSKIAVICRYNLQIDHIKETLENKLKKPIFVIRGDVENKDEVCAQVEAVDECVVLINASTSEGYELPSVGLIIFASTSFSFVDYRQMLGRFLRLNRLKKNVYIHLITEGGVDEAVYQSLKNKQSFDIEVYSRGRV